MVGCHTSCIQRSTFGGKSIEDPIIKLSARDRIPDLRCHQRPEKNVRAGMLVTVLLYSLHGDNRLSGSSSDEGRPLESTGRHEHFYNLNYQYSYFFSEYSPHTMDTCGSIIDNC